MSEQTAVYGAGKTTPAAPRKPVSLPRLAEMRARGERGSIMSLLCDAGARYLPTYCDADWVARSFGDCTAAQQKIDALLG